MKIENVKTEYTKLQNMTLERMSPAAKFFALIFLSFVGSFDYYPFLSISLIILGLFIGEVFSSVKAKALLYSIRAFIGIMVFYTVFMVGLRMLSGQELALVQIFGLSLRMVLISLYSALFIKTTDPIEFILCLIQYYKMPVRVGFAFLTAYRFLPIFRDEWALIVHAHKIRGVETTGNPIKRVWNSKRYMLPLLAGAIRKGVRISIAMETRAFGKYPERTCYRKIQLRKRDVVTALLFCVFIGTLAYTLQRNGWADFQWVYHY